MGLIDVLAPAEDTLQVALSRIEDYSAVGSPQPLP